MGKGVESAFSLIDLFLEISEGGLKVAQLCFIFLLFFPFDALEYLLCDFEVEAGPVFIGTRNGFAIDFGDLCLCPKGIAYEF